MPGKARRRGVGDTSSETEHRSWSFGGLGGHRGSYQNDPLGFGLNNMFVTKKCNTRKYCDLLAGKSGSE